MARSAKKDVSLAATLLAEERTETTDEDIATTTEMFFAGIPGGKLIPIDRLHEWGAQPRKSFDEDRMAELAGSIAEVGVLEPMIVRRHPSQPGHYVVTAGMRRLLAARRVHGAEDEAARRRVEALPCVIREATDREAFADALVENLARQDLTSKEVMEAVVALQDEYGWSIREIGRRTGRADGHLSRLIRVGRDPEVAALVAEEIIPPTTGYYIVDLVDTEVRREIVARVRSGILRTGAEVQNAISVELGRRARERAEARRTPPPLPTLPGRALQANDATGAASSPGTQAATPAGGPLVPTPPDEGYGQVRLKTQPTPDRHDAPQVVQPVEVIPDERIPVQAHTRRVGASSRAERLANYILAQVAQWGTLPLDYPSLERLAEARDALDRALEAHGHD